MNKRAWIVPIMIVAVNALAIIMRWSSLSELLPAHFDLQGNAGGSMSRNILLLYPLIGTVICAVAYMIAHVKRILQKGMMILASGICLVLLCSTLVLLTSGKMPVFMLAEPVILLSALIACVVCVVRSS